MQAITSVLNHRYFFWALLAIPSIPMISLLASGGTGPEGQPAVHFLLHPTGEFAARFMIIAMMITPFKMMFPRNRFWMWMLRRRRYLGVAAFLYAFLHTILYLIDMGTLQAILGDFLALGIWTGWLAFFVFVPLAVTSNNWSVKKMGRGWKTLQRFVYLAAVATLLHWMFVHNEFGPALVHFVPLAALELYRLWKNRQATPKGQPV